MEAQRDESMKSICQFILLPLIALSALGQQNQHFKLGGASGPAASTVSHPVTVLVYIKNATNPLVVSLTKSTAVRFLGTTLPYANDSAHSDTNMPNDRAIGEQISLSELPRTLCSVYGNPNSSTDWLKDCADTVIEPFPDTRAYGAFGDGTIGHTITTNNIAAKTQWFGCGIVNTYGTAVTWLSGAKFLPQLATYSEAITINGTSYRVSSVGSTTSGVATSMTLGTSAGSQSGVRWCIYASGDQWDYVALQEEMFHANSAPGSELSGSRQWEREELSIPCGSYQINKPIIANRAAGMHIQAAQRLCT